MTDMTIDLNCDVGEGVGNESDIFPYISSCNIACGGHAGDVAGMRKIALLAAAHGLRVGAHPSYPDRVNFGRLSMDIGPTDLARTLKEQLQTIGRVVENAGLPLHHIKAHGALYNDLASNDALARLYLEILAPYREGCKLFVPFGSSFSTLARAAGYTICEEGFADRAYHSDGSLVSRKSAGALKTDPEDVWMQVREIVLNRRVWSVEGSWIPMDARTICVHGDTPGALEILMYLSRELSNESIRLSQ